MAANFLGLKSFPVIKTLRLILREIEEADYPSFYQFFCDEKVNEYIQLEWADPTEARMSFNSFRTRFYEGIGIRWTIESTEGKWIGNFGFRNLNPEDKCIERGLQISSEFWRQGYGLEASQAAMDWVAANSSCNKIDAWIAEGNKAAIALLIKQGFETLDETKKFKNLTLRRYLKHI